MTKIVFIGAGSMAEAMIGGWVKKGNVTPQSIYVTNRSDYSRLIDLQNLYGVQILEKIADIADANIIILAMKPKDVVAAMDNIAPYIDDKTAVVSVLAGIPIATIEKGLYARPIARVMPNTSATIGMSASGIAFNDRVTPDLKKRLIDLMKAIGIVVEVEEDQLHAVTALSGSGPAYIYYLLEAFEQIGTQFGLEQHVVRQLMVETIAGAAAMVKSTEEEPSVLRNKVTSPNGTTEAGIRALEANNFAQVIAACVQSAEARSRELANGQ